MVAIVHLVWEHGAVLGQLAGCHRLGVQGPSLGGCSHSGLGGQQSYKVKINLLSDTVAHHPLNTLMEPSGNIDCETE